MNATHNIATVFSPSLWDPGEPIASRRHPKGRAGVRTTLLLSVSSVLAAVSLVDEGVSKVPGVAMIQQECAET